MRKVSQSSFPYELSVLSGGASVDIYNKIFTIKASLLPFKLFVSKYLYLQLGIFGFGDYINFMFRSELLYITRGVVSLKLGLSFPTIHPILNTRIYLKVSPEIQSDDSTGDYIGTGAYVGIGLNMEYNFLD